MFKSLQVRRSQGEQTIPDPRQAQPVGFRGLPIIADKPCAASCSACADACPTQAISLSPVRIDLGRCVFCSECVSACPEAKLRFTAGFAMAASRPEDLQLGVEGLAPLRVSEVLRARFGRSLKLRSVSAGGCNACELEVNALSNVNFDIGRYGIDFVASPRHAYGLVLSGPLTRAMAEAVRLCWGALPPPQLVIAVGACAISGGLYAESRELDRSFLADFPPALYVPGCPPHPLTFVQGILDLLGIPSA